MPRLKQAMLLAAGFSTRLRPLTNDIPKPLLPFLGGRLLDVTLAYLRHQGIAAVATNVHHGRERYLEVLEAYPIEPFPEDPILGTGGGIKNMRPFVRDPHFAVVNCDFVTDVDLKEAFRFHVGKTALATMVLIDDPRKERYGAVGVDGTGRIVAFPHAANPKPAARSGFFSGIHLFRREIFDEMPAEPVFCINRDVYARIVERGGPAFGHVVTNRWYDTGEIREYRETEEALRRDPFGWMQPAG